MLNPTISLKVKFKYRQMYTINNFFLFGEITCLYEAECEALVDGVPLEKTNLLLVDNENGESFTYDMTSEAKKPLLLDKLSKPTTVAKQLTNKGNIYQICYSCFKDILPQNKIFFSVMFTS